MIIINCDIELGIHFFFVSITNNQDWTKIMENPEY